MFCKIILFCLALPYIKGQLLGPPPPVLPPAFSIPLPAYPQIYPPIASAPIPSPSFLPNPVPQLYPPITVPLPPLPTLPCGSQYLPPLPIGLPNPVPVYPPITAPLPPISTLPCGNQYLPPPIGLPNPYLPTAVVPPYAPAVTSIPVITELPLPFGLANPFLPAASPVSALASSLLPLLPPATSCCNGCQYLRKIPISPPCV